jgi:hypothetical protein
VKTAAKQTHFGFWILDFGFWITVRNRGLDKGTATAVGVLADESILTALLRRFFEPGVNPKSRI